VARAYAELEASGLVTSRRRTGTVVTAGPEARPVGEQRVREAAEVLARTARADGVDPDTVLAIVRAALVDRPTSSWTGERPPSPGGTTAAR
jgi:GntR family transcriptional regulator